MKITKIILSFALGFYISANAQNESLSKEITVEKDYIPTEKKASKLNNLPEIKQVEIPEKKLDYSDWAAPTTIKPEIQILPPIGYLTDYNFSDKKGYVRFGIGSYLNMSGSAGYKIIAKEKTALNIWLQHTSTWMGQNNSPNITAAGEIERLKQKFNDNILGIDFAHMIGNKQIGLNAFYHFDRFNYYGGTSKIWDENEHIQTVNQFDIAFSFRNRPAADELKYAIGISFDHFGNSHSLWEDIKAIKENHLQIKGGIEVPVSETSYLGIDADLNYLYYTNPMQISLNGPTITPADHNGYSVNKLSPYYRMAKDKVTLKIGLNIDISANNGTITRFSPDIKFDYKILTGLDFYANIEGGKKINTFAGMSTVNRYFNPSSLLGNSYSPIDAAAGIKIGPFAGFRAQISGGYAIVNNQQTPWMPLILYVNDSGSDADSYPGYFGFEHSTVSTIYSGINMKGWHIAAGLGYKFKEIAELKFDFKYSPQDGEKGYMFSQDRPEYVLNANLNISPVSKLKINLNYEYRGNRNYWTSYSYSSDPVITEYEPTGLKNISLLSLGASYQINHIFSIFAQFNNILNKKWDIYYGLGAQKFNAQGGISVLF